MDLLTASVIVLWILVVVLVVVVIALARQVGVLYERVAPAGALMINQQLSVGDTAPQIGVENLDGSNCVLGAPGRAQLLFFLSPDCPICKSLLPVLKTFRRVESSTDILLLSDGEDRTEHDALVASESLQDFTYGLSEAAGRSYGVSKLPYAVLIDTQGVIRSLGIVNSREHLESLFEAERLGVASIQEFLDGTPGETDLHYDASRPNAG